MADVELTRSPGDRRLYVLEGVGTLRLEGLASRRATAAATGGRWRIARRGMWRASMEATDAAGAVVGEFDPRGGVRRGGTVKWAGRPFSLGPRSGGASATRSPTATASSPCPTARPGAGGRCG